MIATIIHGINLVRHYCRDLAVSSKRSGKWPTIEKHFLEANTSCAACGSKKRLNAHHIFPFHLFPEKELDPNNLITLCMFNDCHLLIGHAGSFKKFVPEVRKYAAEALAHPEKFNQIVKLAAIHFLIN